MKRIELAKELIKIAKELYIGDLSVKQVREAAKAGAVATIKNLKSQGASIPREEILAVEYDEALTRHLYSRSRP